MKNSSINERRRRGLSARVQRALTGWLFDALCLRRRSDEMARQGVIQILNAMMLVLFLHRPSAASAGTEGASFLDIPVGARPAAMGSAYTALATDAYAPVWNPAGLGFLDDTEVAGQHLSYLESIHYEFLGLVHPFQKGRALGFSMQYLGSGDIPSTDIKGNSIGTFSSHYAAYSVAYGHAFTKRLALGLSAKLINAKIDDVGANAYAVDFGALYRWNDRLSLASTLTNVGTKLKFLSEGDPLPLSWHVAAAYQALPSLLFQLETIYAKNGLGSGHFGAEWHPIEPIAIRVGYRTDTLKGLSPLAGLTTGIGIKVMGQEFAYAWLPYGELGSAQYFSLLLRFGAAADAKRNLIQYQSIKRHNYVKGDSKSPTPTEYTEIKELLQDGPASYAQAVGSPSTARATLKNYPDSGSNNQFMEAIEREMTFRVAEGDQAKHRKSKRKNKQP